MVTTDAGYVIQQCYDSYKHDDPPIASTAKGELSYILLSSARRKGSHTNYYPNAGAEQQTK